jgi:hypothetical protein
MRGSPILFPILLTAIACDGSRGAPVQGAHAEHATASATPPPAALLPAAPSSATPSAMPSASNAPTVVVSCANDGDCAIDATRAACLPRSAPVEKTARWVCGSGEAYCACDSVSHSCTRRIVETSACATDQDCDIQKVGEFEIPVRLPKPRSSAIKPCGPSHVPKCREGVCMIALYKC